MSEKKQKEIEEAVADGDWKKVYELEHNIEHKETNNLLKGICIGYGLAMTGVAIGGVAVHLVKKKGWYFGSITSSLFFRILYISYNEENKKEMFNYEKVMDNDARLSRD